MMKKLQKISVLLLTIIMALGNTVTASAASSTSTAAIDKDKKGSITITKTDSKDVSPAIIDSAPQYTPLEGVTYTLYRVAAIEQGSVTGGEVSLSYSSVIPGLTVTSETTAVQIEAAINALAAANTPVAAVDAKTTTSTGVVKFENLELGIYLAYESDYPSTVKVANSFIVSVPMTNADGNEWIYDIEAAPKNDLDEPKIDKWIIVDPVDGVTPIDDVLSKAEDYNIGDTVSYQIKSAVPLTIDRLAAYKITDTLSAGLTYTAGSLKVYGASTAGGIETAALLTAGVDYKLVVSGQEIYINFYTTKLAGYDDVYVTFDAILNENAKIYTDGNPNDVKLEYSNLTSTGSKPGTPEEPEEPNEPLPGDRTALPSIPPIVYTYKIQVNKVDKDGEKLAGVKFELQDTNGNKINIAQDSNGYYVDKAAGASILTTDINGVIYIRGLDNGIYFLVETETLPGYTLLTKPIEIYITSEVVTPVYSVESDIEIGDYFKIESGKDYYVEQGAEYAKVDLTDFSGIEYVSIPGAVYAVTLGDPILVDGNLDGTPVTKYVRSSIFNEIESSTNANPVTVTNILGYELPGTGGMGLMVIRICGIALIGLAGVMLLVYYKRRKRA